VAVTLHWGNGEMICPLGWRLYLPKEWMQDTERSKKVKLPTGTVYKTKVDLALDLIDQALNWELPQLPVVDDSFYGNDFGFREALRSRELHYVMAVEPTTVVWSTDPNVPLPPSAPRGRPRWYPPKESLLAAEDLLALAQSLPASAWRAVCWREGTRDKQRSRFALTKVWAAHGWRKQEHPERVAEWLLVE
jgi:SRSO17 transposase